MTHKRQNKRENKRQNKQRNKRENKLENKRENNRRHCDDQLYPDLDESILWIHFMQIEAAVLIVLNGVVGASSP